MIDFVKVGERIAYHRRRIGLSQEELASRLYVTRQAVSKWENGSSAPSIDAISELSQLFCISFEEILGLFSDVPNDIEADNLFRTHDRGYIINKIVLGELNVDIPDVLYQMSPAERMYILKFIKDGKLDTDIKKLMVKLTPSELAYMNKKGKDENGES